MSSSYLQLKSETWNRESINLFDYDCSKVIRQDLIIESSGSLIRKENILALSSDTQTPDSGELLKIFQNYEEFIITPSKEEAIGIVINRIKSKNKKGFLLSEGDTIKLGKAKVKVKKICVGCTNIEENFESDENFEGSNSGEMNCRICFRTHTNIVDPMLTICKCAGSMAFIHLKCLQKWFIHKSLKKISPNCCTYRWKNLKCDICKENVPLSAVVNDVKYELIELPKPKTNYLVLRDYRNDKYEHILHLLTPNQMNLLIGRATDTDLRINDISVSRNHAIIELFHDKFYLKDCDSKFGTLVMVKNPITLGKKTETVLQIGKTVLEFRYKKKNKIVEIMKNCCKKYNKVDAVPRSRTEIVWEEASLRSSDSPE